MSTTIPIQHERYCVTCGKLLPTPQSTCSNLNCMAWQSTMKTTIELVGVRFGEVTLKVKKPDDMSETFVKLTPQSPRFAF